MTIGAKLAVIGELETMILALRERQAKLEDEVADDVRETARRGRLGHDGPTTHAERAQDAGYAPDDPKSFGL